MRAVARYVVSLAVAFLGCQAAALAASITVAWNPNPEPDIAGYRLMYGLQSGMYDTTVDVGKVTVFQVTGLNVGTTYYFALSAYNTSNLVSALSNEVSGAPAEPPPDPCARPLGEEAIAVFITDIGYTTRRANSKSFVDLQMSSKSPIQKTSVNINGTPVSSVNGLDLTNLRGIWFMMPSAPGAYALTMTLQNAFGCVVTTTSARTVIVIEP